MNIQTRTALAALLLFTSGLCALIYQTVWFREFRLIFGASTASSAAVLGIFMGGLGLGSALLGKRMERVKNPLAMYGYLELGIAAAAALSPGLLWLVRQAYIATGGSTVLHPFLATVIRLALATLVLIIPTILMGGTLPAVARAVSSAADSGRRSLAVLYGTNTMGAVTGAVISTFFLIEIFGNRHTLWLACGLNALVAIFACRLSRMAGWQLPETEAAQEEPASEPALPSEAPASEPQASPAFVLTAAGAVGFAFMLMELVWYRMLSPILGGSTFTFGLILAVALLGIGLGGWLYSMFQARRPVISGFAWTCALEALFIAIPFAMGDLLARLALALRSLGELGFAGQMFGWSIITAIVVLPAAIVAGYQFPMLIALLGSGQRDVARHTGQAYAANTAGAILGSLAGGFGLLPVLTATGAWRGVAILLAALAICAVWGAMRRRQAAFVPALVTSLIAVALLFAFEGPTAPWRHGGIGAGRAKLKDNDVNGVRNWMHSERRSIAWQAEGVESSVGLSTETGYAFVVNGKVDGHIRSDAGTQVMAGLLANLLRPAENCMVIGLGTGSTAGWLALAPEMKRVDVVELEPAILHIARLCGPANQHVMDNPKVKIHIGDAREALLTTPNRYDLIFSEPSNPYRAGIASLFTRDFYSSAKERLNTGGVFAQWIQAYEVDGRALRTAYATLGSVFAHVETWQTQGGDLLMLATDQPFAHDAAALRARISAEPYRSALLYAWEVDRLEGVLARHIADRRLCQLVIDSGEEQATDDRNSLEFGFAKTIGAHFEQPLSQTVREYSRSLGFHRLAIQGEVDWDEVDRQIVLAVELSPETAAKCAAEKGADSARWEVVRAFVHERSFPAVVARWKKEPFEPRSYAELRMLALCLSHGGDPAAWEMVQKLHALRPGDAEGLWAWMYADEKNWEKASAHAHNAILHWREDPWSPITFVASILKRATETAKSAHPETVESLYAALKEPFCVKIANDARISAALEIASTMAKGKPGHPVLQEALGFYGENYPWTDRFLRFRAVTLRDAKSAHALDAAYELLEYEARELERFEQGLPLKPVEEKPSVAVR